MVRINNWNLKLRSVKAYIQSQHSIHYVWVCVYHEINLFAFIYSGVRVLYSPKVIQKKNNLSVQHRSCAKFNYFSFSIFFLCAVPPSQPLISGYVEGSIIPAGSVQKLLCVSSGGNPLATLTWYKNDKKVGFITGSISNSAQCKKLPFPYLCVVLPYRVLTLLEIKGVKATICSYHPKSKYFLRSNSFLFCKLFWQI